MQIYIYKNSNKQIMSIYFNNSSINDWYFADDSIVKVYRNNSIVFYKVIGVSPTPEYKVCFAVVDDITQYQETEFEDVYDKATKKWYKLNNLNQYEKYGAYGSGRSVTTYKGKLTIDEGYEYEWNGSEWVNLGEVIVSSRVPIGYVELTYAQTSKINSSSSSSNAFTVPIDLQETNNYIYEFTPLNWGESYYGHMIGGNDNSTNFPKWGIFKLDNGWGDETKRFVSAFWNYNLETRGSSPGGNYRVYSNVKSKFTMNLHNYTVGQGADIKVENEGYETVTHTSTTILRSGYSVTSGIYNIDVFSTSNGNSAYIALEQFHNLKVETNEGVAVYDYVPCKRNSDNKVGLYDVVNNAFYSPSAFTLTAGDEASHTEYPKYYSEKSDPLNNLTFNTMAEAKTYAKANCVYDGMRATIDGDRYYFDSSDENGWLKIFEYYNVDLNSQWQDSTSYGSLSSDTANYDFYESFRNYNYDFGKATMFITIDGYASFTFKVRNYSESSYDYVVVNNLDDTTVPSWQPSVGSGTASSGKVYYTNKSKSSNTTWYDVTFNNLDGGEHIITVTYGKDGSGHRNDDRGYVAIPKKQ